MNTTHCECCDPFSDDTFCINKEAIHLRDRFRLLWEQHVYWTRIVILGIIFDLPDREQSTNRLLRNASDFAKVFCRFYGNRVAAELERLITDHLVIAAELVTAAKAGNTRLAAATERRWYENADAIVCLLSDINPCWTVEDMRAMWYCHLAMTKDEAVFILEKKYNKSIETFNAIEKEALQMADVMSNGIICQFSFEDD